ncbi:hypothetical protein BDV39DRAFT_206188 [Aspergillus sergii]|uniref:Peptidase C14 caspase domain-containing protein n=1 Tax=Aspergillus sergii TaxID=1034303 RepID=A0A5N6WZD1_9EURO|nr:hypothetical protein BDV39DRAFT_206188 [Aspergillus sergii]
MVKLCSWLSPISARDSVDGYISWDFQGLKLIDVTRDELIEAESPSPFFALSYVFGEAKGAIVKRESVSSSGKTRSTSYHWRCHHYLRSGRCEICGRTLNYSLILEMSQASNHWALLIGINFYPIEANHNGAVNDVGPTQSYMWSDINPVGVTVLKASSTKEPRAQPCEDPAIWPTMLNTISTLERIGEAALEGDFVYMYFSGHGRSELLRGKYGYQETGDARLIVLSSDASKEEYLNGFLLTNRVKRLVNELLKVTLVLDCCFSGHVYRQSHLLGTAVRRSRFTSAEEHATVF